MAKARFSACNGCRSDAQKVAGITERQRVGLAMGSVKGTNHRIGYRHREESKLKTSTANKQFWSDNPDKAAERGAKLRGPNHYKWKGGITNLNKALRTMTENRKWMDAVKVRDGRCVRCGAGDDLETHHKKSLSALMYELGIRSCDDARQYAAELWDLNNGETLCRSCHYSEHGRALPCE